MPPAHARRKAAGLNLACGEARPLKRPEYLKWREGAGRP